MKRHIIYSVIVLFFIISCTKESNEPIESSSIQASDFTISLEENPENETIVKLLKGTFLCLWVMEIVKLEIFFPN